MARKLRIAVSVFFGLLTVAMCVLWVRSHRYSDVVNYDQNTLVLNSLHGYGVILSCENDDLPENLKGWRIATFESDGSFVPHSFYRFDADGFLLASPYWLVALITATIATIAALKPRPLFERFSLRTLLIATTLVAVVLGLAVWAAS